MKAKWKLIISMATFGTIGLFIKYIPLSSAEVALYRAVIGSLAILLYKFISKEKLDFFQIKKDLFLLFLSGVAIGMNWILLFQAYRYTTLSVATLSYYFAPVIVMILCPLLFREHLTGKQVLCFVMSTFGLILVIGIGGFGFNRSHLIGILFGLSAAAFYAAVIILNKFIKHITGIDRTLIQFIAAIIVLLPYVAVTTGIHLDGIGYRGAGNLLVVGVIHTGMMYCLYFSSVKELRGQELAILSYIDPLVAIIVSVLILGEAISGLQVLGGILILGFTLYNEV
ncbi:MAG: DMT family transporter, partial [Lachnospiraceae bacterium]